MEFKVFLLCCAVLVAAASAAKDIPNKAVSKYTLKINKDGKDYEEKVDVDTEKETETFHVTKTSPDNEAGDIVYNFKKNLTMIHLPAANSCFLSDSTDDVPKPAALKKLLESKSGKVGIPREQTEVKLKVVGTLEDRSELSDEMEDLCENLPIYVVVEGEKDSTAVVKPTATVLRKRSKRNLELRWVCNWLCRHVCRRVCSGWNCHTVCQNMCTNFCQWTWVASG